MRRDPDVTQASALEARALAAALPALMLAARQLAGQVDAGRHGRRRSGAGEQFWQYRAAEAGDSRRMIDWRRSARSEKLFRREQEAQSSAVLLIGVDRHAGMAWSSAPGVETKLARAVVLALACGCLALAAGERVAVLGQSHAVSGQGSLAQLAAGLLVARLDDAPVMPGGVLALFGDFFDAPEQSAARLGRLGSGLRGGVLVQVLDPAELDFRYHGRVLFEDMGGRPRVDEGNDEADVARAEAIAPAFRARMTAQIAAVAAVARAARLTPILHRTDQAALAALMAIYPALAAARGRFG